MQMNLWHQTLAKAFSECRPRGVRFQFGSDFADKSVWLSLQTDKPVKGAKREEHEGLPWYTFQGVADEELTPDSAKAFVKTLFAGFGVK